jgi:hypothetical protein
VKAETIVGQPGEDGRLGEFRRGPAVFAVLTDPVESGSSPSEYRITCDDGAGPRVICRFVADRKRVPEWFGAWKNDEWCEWILKQARIVVADRENT